MFFAISASAQDCDCYNEFTYLKDYIENNHPGYNSVIKNNELKNYEKKCTEIRNSIKITNPGKECIFYLEKYIQLLKDNHLSIEPVVGRLRKINEKDSVEVNSFRKSDTYTRHELMRIDTIALIKSISGNNLKDPQGIYQFGKLTRFILIKNKTASRDYVGVVLTSKSKLWQTGHVVMELKNTTGNKYNVTLYTPGFESISMTCSFINGGFPYFGIFKSDAKKEKSRPYEFREINKKTNYIRLSSFNGSYFKELDSLYTVHDLSIRSKPNLIIDIRDNEGGNQQCYAKLLSYLYTRPIFQDTAELWVSEANIKRYSEKLNTMLQDSLSYGSIAIQNIRKQLKRMEGSALTTFITQFDSLPAPILFDSVCKTLKNVAIIYNRNTASSGEAFIFNALQSSKVITFGESSGGFAGYGNVMQTKTPSSKYSIRCATTRYKNQYKYEFKGITPQHDISGEKNWLEFTISFLNKNNETF